MKKVLSISFLIMILTTGGDAFCAEQKSKLFVYNSSYDLKRGDLWEYISPNCYSLGCTTNSTIFPIR
jgi:hypothetical protein